MTNIASKPSVTVTLAQLVVSQLNLRSHDGADDRIPDLAATLMPGAAGQLIPLFVKPATDANMFEILDGRRRYLAWSSLLDAGAITAEHAVTVKICETEDEVAQAVVIANAMRKEIQYADILLTLQRLISEHYTFDDIARTLGVDIKEIRKMSTLSRLDPRILQAFKAQRLRLPLLRKIARIKDADKVDELAQMLEESEGPVNEYHMQDVFDEEGIYANNAILNAFPITAYLAKGGRIEQDLFEEFPDKILDPKILGGLWKSAMKPVVKALKAAGLTVDFDVNLGYGNPEGFRDLGWEFKRQSEGDKKRIAELKTELETLKSELKMAGDGAEHAKFLDISKTIAAKSLETFNEEAKPLYAKACKASLAANGGLKIEFFVDTKAYDAFMTRDVPEEMQATGRTCSHGPVVDNTPLPKTNLRPDVTLYGHVHHLRTTTLAGRALARSLVDTPMVALDVQLSAQFQQVVLGRSHDTGKYVLKVCASTRMSGLNDVESPLTAPVVERLQAYKAQYDETGMHPFEWVSTLTPSEKLDLLANITAAQIDMSEMRTDYVRQDARAEAILICRTIGHDFSAHMQVEPDYYAAFSKKALLAILVKMGLDPEEYAHLKRGQLAETVHGLAIERGFVPPALNFHEADYFEIATTSEEEEEGADDTLEAGADDTREDAVEDVVPIDDESLVEAIAA